MSYEINRSSDIANKVLLGYSIINPEDVRYINRIVRKFIKEPNHKLINEMLSIITLSNALYNNAHDILLPLDDDLYDQLIVVMKKMGVDTPVGSPVVKFKDLDLNKSICKSNNKTTDTKLSPMYFVENNYFYKNIITANSYDYIESDFNINKNIDDNYQPKLVRGISHKYDLCGTLSKCKYTLDKDAKLDGKLDSPGVFTFERDFLKSHIDQGIVNPNNIELMVSLKYDGISVEASVKGDTLISACTRGDLSNNEASDLTYALYGTKFHRATNVVNENEEFGIKFEYIITYYNLQRLMNDFGKIYVNPRNAVIGLLGGLDAYKYKDYITPVPLETSIQNINRIDEVEFLNKFYSKDVGFRYTIVRGNYHEVLYQIDTFVKEAASLRDYNGFQYDGVVVEYIDPNIRNFLGKVNSIPKYAIAIKFPPMRQITRFDHYEYTVGQNGVVTPMAIYDPVKFFGAVNYKTTVHSYKRFKELNLKKNDKICVTFVNDVMAYISKPDESYFVQNNNDIEPEEFPKYCPCCGEPLLLSDSGSTAICPNFYCDEKVYARMTNTLDKLNIKDFSTQTLRLLEIQSFTDFLNMENPDNITKARKLLGDILTKKLIEKVKYIKISNYPDYRFIGSLGFDSIAIETWKKIMSNIDINCLINYTDMELESLTTIKGIGVKTVGTIITERKYFLNDLKNIRDRCKYQTTVSSTSVDELNKPSVRFSGFRPDSDTLNLLESKGFEVSIDRGVTKDTSILLVPFLGFDSNNVRKAFKYLSKSISALNKRPINIGYDNCYQVLSTNANPKVMTLDTLLTLLDNQN